MFNFLKRNIAKIINSFIVFYSILMSYDILVLLFNDYFYNHALYLNWYIFLFSTIITLLVIFLMFLFIINKNLKIFSLVCISLIIGFLSYFLTFIKMNIIISYEVIILQNFNEYIFICIKLFLNEFKNLLKKILIDEADCSKKNKSGEIPLKKEPESPISKYGYKNHNHKTQCSGVLEQFIRSSSQNYREDPNTTFSERVKSHAAEKIVLNQLKDHCKRKNKKFANKHK